MVDTNVYGSRMSLGENIRRHREFRNWTLEFLSELSDVEIGTISALENRKSKRSEFAIGIAEAFGFSLEVLYDDVADPADYWRQGQTVNPPVIERSKRRKAVLAIWDDLNDEGQRTLMTIAEAMSKTHGLDCPKIAANH